MTTANLLARFAHVIAATAWIGGMLFIALVVVPVVRSEDPARRARLVRAIGRRFRAVAWVAIGLLVASGLVNLWARPYLLESPRFLVKLALVLVAIGLAVAHDFVLGPRAGDPGAPPELRVRASWLARVNLVVALAVVFLGLALRG
jgi:putative copper export protein